MCFIGYRNPSDCTNNVKLWTILRNKKIPDCLAVFMQNVRTLTLNYLTSMLNIYGGRLRLKKKGRGG